MKKIYIIAAIATLLVSPGLQAMAEEAAVTGDVYVGVNNMYLSRGIDVLPDADFVAQPGLDLSFGGFKVSLWANYDENSSEVTETDITLDYTFAVNDLVSFSFGNAYYVYDGVPDTNELYVACALNTLLTPTLKLYYDWDASTETGVWATLAVSHRFSLMENLGLTLGSTVGYNAENYSTSEAYSNFQMAEFRAAVDWAINKNISLTPAVTYSVPLSDDAKDLGGIEEEVMVGLSFAYVF